MDAGRIVDPFATTPDPGAYVPRPASERAVAAVESALVEGARVVWLSGPPGIGKTLLLHRLRERLESRLRFVHMPYANVPPGGLWLWVGSELGVERGLEPRRAVRRFAAQAASEGTALVLAMDDAEALPDDTLQSLIATVEAEAGLRLVLVSGEELELGPVLPEGTRHIRFAEPMDPEETRAYVEARLARAGADSAVRARFDAAGVRWLYRESGGIPLLVNSLADRIARREAGPPVADALAGEAPSEAPATPQGDDGAPRPRARAEEPPPLETDGPSASERREAASAEAPPPARERAPRASAEAADEGLDEILEGTRVGPARPQAPNDSFDFEPPWRAQRRTKGRKGSTSRPGRAARSRGRSRAAERRRGRGGRGGGGGVATVILALAIGFLAGALFRDALGPDPRRAVAELVAPRGPAAPGPVAAPPPQREGSPTPEAPEGEAAAGDVAAGSPAPGAEASGADAEGGAPTAGPPLQVRESAPAEGAAGSERAPEPVDTTAGAPGATSPEAEATGGPRTPAPAAEQGATATRPAPASEGPPATVGEAPREAATARSGDAAGEGPPATATDAPGDADPGGPGAETSAGGTSPDVAAPPPAAAAPPPAGPRGLLHVTADPRAMIEVDGVVRGPTPLHSLELVQGAHRVVARFPDGTVAQRTVELGEEAWVDFP